jgi:hypothetical protein
MRRNSLAEINSKLAVDGLLFLGRNRQSQFAQ